jgi:hypothetical protein
MLSYQTYGIDAYLLLLHQWLDHAFPEPRSQEAAAKLDSIWLALAYALCNFDQKKLVRFAGGNRLGEPPFGAIEQQLRAAEQAGIQEGFLAVAMREATEYLIARDLPDALAAWTALADQLVPQWMWFSQRGDQSAPNKAEYRV